MTNEEMCPLVTVVTATYKKFDHIYETIRSVLNQDYKRIEYIICDDGSPDFPEEEINSYVKENGSSDIDFKIIRQPKNVGTVKNLNAAYKASKGEYVTNVSCGDVLFTQDVISRIVKVFQKEKASLVATSRLLYSGNYEPICLLPHYEERKILSELKTPEEQYKALILHRFYDMASGSALAFSREILEETGYFDESYVLWEDGPFLTKYLQKNKLCMAYDIISIWYETGGVSTKGHAAIHPLLKKDIQNYNKDERIRRREILSRSEKKLLDYEIKLEEKQTKYERLPLFIRYFPQMRSNKRYISERNARIASDKQEIQRIMKEGKTICR